MPSQISPPSVGIVILNYNHAKLTLDCIQSISKQEYKNYRIVVVDNDSPDPKQKEILRTEISKDVILIFNPQNTGYAAGNNVGARYCVEKLNSDYVFILNNDTILEDENTIKKLVEPLEKNDNIVAISPLVEDTNAAVHVRKKNQVRKLLSLRKMIICNINYLGILPFFKKIVNEYLYVDLMPFSPCIHEVDSINGSAFMISSWALKQINYLDEKTFLYYEELVLGFQIKQIHKTCALNGEIVVKHFQGLSTGNNKFKITWKMHKYAIESFVVLLKNYYHASQGTIIFFKISRIFDFVLRKIALRITNTFR